ncbi:ankyrin repeat domain-containing protein 39 [Bombyx mori]|uniref:ankyrin repeat domain-containing protein 39 n=1 Tax=Bombyx mori TaxID=7091 RepID=UPI00035015FC
MSHKNCDHNNCAIVSTNSSVCQTLTEMDWERGLWYAAFHGDKDRVQYLIDKANNAKEIVNAPDNSGYTALHYAARSGHLDICKILLQNGANINAVTHGKVTSLHKAVAAGEVFVVKYLIQSGAKIDLQDNDGQTVLHKAVENNKLDLIPILLDACPDLKLIKNNKGHYATEFIS